MLENFEIYVINLDRSSDRWVSIKEHLETLGLSPTRLSAVDAREMSEHDLHLSYNKTLNKNDYFIPLKAAEIGCFLSHQKALKVFLTQSEKPFAIILEDDVEFIHPPQQLVNLWLKVLESAQPVMLKLYKRRAVWGRSIAMDDINKIIQPHLVPLGTQAQLVNRAAAQKLVDAFHQFGMPVDVAYQHWWQHGVKTLVTLPNQVNEISAQIDGSNISSGDNLSFGYKAKREVKRSYFRLKLSIKSRWYYMWQSCFRKIITK